MIWSIRRMLLLITIVFLGTQGRTTSRAQTQSAPSYVLVGLQGGQAALVRLSDWKVAYMGKGIGRGVNIGGIAYFPQANKAILVLLDAGLSLELVDFTTCSVAPLARPRESVLAGKNIVSVFLHRGDPEAVYVMVSNRYSSLNEPTSLEDQDLSIWRYQVPLGSWSSRGPKVALADMMPVPDGLDIVPGCEKSIEKTPAGTSKGDSEKKGQTTQWGAEREKIGKRLEDAGVIRKYCPAFRKQKNVDALLSIGGGYALCRSSGSLKLVDMSSGNVKVLASSETKLASANAGILTPDVAILVCPVQAKGFAGCGIWQ